MHDEYELLPALRSMLEDGWISEVLYEVKSGKEATVHCCRAGDRATEVMQRPEALLAAKVYRNHRSRRFKNDGIYQAGRPQFARPSRVKRAIENRSAFGRAAHAALWIDHEWSLMRSLASAGLDVPMPLAVSDEAILMPFLGDEISPAPMLKDVSLDREVVAVMTDRILDNIEAMLDLHCIHGDLSPFNILYWNDRVHIIDFPQAVDPRMNPAAQALLMRDLEHICRWAAAGGVHRDAQGMADELWRRFVLGELG